MKQSCCHPFVEGAVPLERVCPSGCKTSACFFVALPESTGRHSRDRPCSPRSWASSNVRCVLFQSAGRSSRTSLVSLLHGQSALWKLMFCISSRLVLKLGFSFCRPQCVSAWFHEILHSCCHGMRELYMLRHQHFEHVKTSCLERFRQQSSSRSRLAVKLLFFY